MSLRAQAGLERWLSGGCGKGFLCWRTDPKRRDKDDVDGANCRLTNLEIQVTPVQRISTGTGGGRLWQSIEESERAVDCNVWRT